MGNDNFLKNSFLLTASNVTTGILGFIFNIYLSSLLGPEGMGLYNLVMPIYNLFICLMSAGIVASISKIAAVYEDKGEYNNIKKTINVICIFNISWAVLVGLLVFISAPFIGKYGVSDIRTVNAIRVICPAMVFIATSNIFKGYFYGTSKITIPAVLDILEKAMRIITVTILILVFKAETIETMVTLATIALCIGELQSLIGLYIYYRYCISKTPSSHEVHESRIQLLFNVMIISIPLCLNGFLTNILGTMATLIVPRRLIIAGFTHSESLSLIGKYTGMAATMLTIPLIVVSTINTLLIPDLSQTISSGQTYKAAHRIKKVIKLAFLLGLSTTIICNIVPDSLGIMFYNRDDLGLYIKFASFAAPIFFTSATMFGILNGLNRQAIILRNSLIEAVIELICLFIFTAIPSINIYGYSIAMILATSVSFALNFHEVKKHIDVEINHYNVVIYLLLGFLTFLIIKILSLHLFVNNYIVNNLIVIASTFFIFVYLGTFGEIQ